MVTCKLLFKDGITVSFLLLLSSYFYVLVIAVLYIIMCQVYMSKNIKKKFFYQKFCDISGLSILLLGSICQIILFITINVSVLFSLLCFLLQSTPTRMAPPITKNLTVTTFFCIPIPRDVFLYFYIIAIKTFYSNNNFLLVP